MRALIEPRWKTRITLALSHFRFPSGQIWKNGKSKLLVGIGVRRHWTPQNTIGQHWPSLDIIGHRSPPCDNDHWWEFDLSNKAHLFSYYNFPSFQQFELRSSKNYWRSCKFNQHPIFSNSHLQFFVACSRIDPNVWGQTSFEPNSTNCPAIKSLINKLILYWVLDLRGLLIVVEWIRF